MSPQALEHIQSIAIVGLGLLGGSLAFAIKEKFPTIKLYAWARRQETLDTAKQMGIIDAGSTQPEDILPYADLTIICIPLNSTIEFSNQYKHLFKPQSIVIDVGSVKQRIVNELTPLFKSQNIEFLGCHPMAGSHHSGLEYANSKLYEGALCFITPTDENQPTTIELIQSFWKTIGMRPHLINSKEHDFLAARTSHTLHLVAAATVNTYLAHEDASLATGGAFRDFSRIAGSSPEMWTAISDFNRPFIIHAMAELEEEIARVRRLICDEEWDKLYQYLNHSREQYNQWFTDWTQNKQK